MLAASGDDGVLLADMRCLSAGHAWPVESGDSCTAHGRPQSYIPHPTLMGCSVVRSHADA